MKKLVLLSIIGILAIASCKKDNFERFTPSSGGFDIKMVTASFSGIIVSSDEKGLQGVTVTIGTHTTSTDENGVFFFKEISVANTKAYFQAQKDGYFNGSRTIFAQANHNHQVRIKMLDIAPIGSIMNNTGGVVTLSEGGKLTFEAGDVAYPNGDPFTGQVFVAAKRIDPTTMNGLFEMPGDLRGIAPGDKNVTLASYGMMAVELTDNSGNLLQVAPNQTVDMTSEVPSSLVASAPSEIPLWYFDEDEGEWKNEGTATLSGTTYEGKVGHFSYWNFDAKFPRVYFEAKFVDQNGNPLANAVIPIELPDGTRRIGITNDSGWVGGEVMANATMKIFYAADLSCSSLAQYIMDFSTTNLDINLGTITVILNGPLSYTLSGTLVNCNDSPVSNGYIYLQTSNWYLNSGQSVNTDGSFSFNYTTCIAVDSAFIIAYDYDNLEQSDVLGYDITVNTDLGNVKACGIVVDEHLTFNYTTSLGTDTTVVVRPPNLTFTDSLGTVWDLLGRNANWTESYFLYSDDKGIGTYSGKGLFEGNGDNQNFNCVFTVTSYPTALGEYLEGSFSSIGATPLVTGTYRVKW